MAFSDSVWNCSMRCAKIVLLGISLLFALVAIMLIMIGSAIQAYLYDFIVFIDESLLAAPALLISIGAILLIVVLLGAFGALKESVMLINLYGVFLFLVFILEISAAITATVFSAQVYSMVAYTMDVAMGQYYTNPYVTNSVDFVQREFHCCGKNGANDWQTNMVTEFPDNSNATLAAIPDSCCYDYAAGESTCVSVYYYGCLTRLDFIISSSFWSISCAATSAAIIQVMGVFSAFMLARTLRRNKSLRSVDRWQSVPDAKKGLD